MLNVIPFAVAFIASVTVPAVPSKIAASGARLLQAEVYGPPVVVPQFVFVEFHVQHPLGVLG